MVPSGCWTQEKISTIAKSWNEQKQELNVTEILPADNKSIDMYQVADRLTHLLSNECEQLRHVLLDFSDLFQGTCGKFNGEPVSLELVPGSEPFYGKPFFDSQGLQTGNKGRNKPFTSTRFTYTSSFMAVGSTYLHHPQEE